MDVLLSSGEFCWRGWLSRPWSRWVAGAALPVATVLGDAVSGELGEVRVQFDAEPVTVEVFGGNGGGACAEEGVED